MEAYEIEPERVDAFHEAMQRGLVHEFSAKKGHPTIGSELELRKGGPKRRTWLAAELELEGFAHDGHSWARHSSRLSREAWK
jgi:hypothetical protein